MILDVRLVCAKCGVWVPQTVRLKDTAGTIDWANPPESDSGGALQGHVLDGWILTDTDGLQASVRAWCPNHNP